MRLTFLNYLRAWKLGSAWELLQVSRQLSLAQGLKCPERGELSHLLTGVTPWRLGSSVSVGFCAQSTGDGVPLPVWASCCAAPARELPALGAGLPV